MQIGSHTWRRRSRDDLSAASSLPGQIPPRFRWPPRALLSADLATNNERFIVSWLIIEERVPLLLPLLALPGAGLHSPVLPPPPQGAGVSNRWCYTVSLRTNPAPLLLWLDYISSEFRNWVHSQLWMSQYRVASSDPSDFFQKRLDCRILHENQSKG